MVSRIFCTRFLRHFSLFCISVMLSEQEETINKYKTRLRELGEDVASDVDDEENDDDIT